MINLDDNNQAVSPEIGKIIVKDFTKVKFTPDDEKDFHVKSINEDTLIDFAGELDDQHEFAMDMFNRGTASDLPDSDRSQNCQTMGIDHKTCFDKDL